MAESPALVLHFELEVEHYGLYEMAYAKKPPKNPDNAAPKTESDLIDVWSRRERTAVENRDSD